MTTFPAAAPHRVGIAFDSIAERYDDMFTRSLLGRAQRDAVWDVLGHEFRSGDRVLELNCGTGEDALFLARKGIFVLACDASAQMIAVASRRMEREPSGGMVQVELLPIEHIGELESAGPFDGIFSNFSGLNCVSDLADVARQLAGLIEPGGRMLFCLSTRICLWETLWYLTQGDPKRAFRRWRGHALASLGEMPLEMRYPTMRYMRELFHPFFRLLYCRGIGVTVPPSYVEHIARRHPRFLKKLQAIDRVISGWPICRGIGDHVLLGWERNN